MESLTYDKNPDYYKYQAHLYQLLEKEMFLTYSSEHLGLQTSVGIIGLLGEAFCWLSEKKGGGIGVACNLIMQLCRSEKFKSLIDIAKWILSERQGEDIFPSNMDQLNVIIKEFIIEFIIEEFQNQNNKIEITPKDIFGDDYHCSHQCSHCRNMILCFKLREKEILLQRQTIYI